MKVEHPVLYRYRLEGGEAYPDPASRYQPEGPLGPSQAIDPLSFAWTDHTWRGPAQAKDVLYEMHIGTFTQEGTWRAATAQLDTLADIGITIIEMMPIADFVGRFGWGYDGVNLFAPTHLYGGPDDLRDFVDRAHALGMGVVLDVVYNHLGPDGNYLDQFAHSYFSAKHTTDWGKAINFYGPGSKYVREYFIANARYWIDEFHFDGLRLDATQNIYDQSSPHILAEVAAVVRNSAGGRRTFLVAENESQDTRLLRDAEHGGMALDALWNDDFHHTTYVALTGMAEAYYSDYRGTPQEIISAVRAGFLYQGQYYSWQKNPRGTPTDGLETSRFVSFLENHDQVANSAYGLRMHELSQPGDVRALTALMLLAPSPAMLFQGQEYNAPQPFLYFADHKPEIAADVRKGRAKFLEQFPSLATSAVQASLHDPADPREFERCKLDPADRTRNAGVVALHKDLIALGRTAPFVTARRAHVEGAVLGAHAFVLRFMSDDHTDAIVLVNLGDDLLLSPLPEPLLAPPAGGVWREVFSSESVTYGGHGTAAVETKDGFHMPGHSAIVLKADIA